MSANGGRVRCRARVVVTLEIDAGSVWGDEANLAEVFRICAKESVQNLERLLQPTDCRIISTPQVTAVIAPDKAT